MPCLQDSHLALYAWQQFLYFSQPQVDGFFLQYSFSLKPAAQERHWALFALQQPLYFSQPPVDGFFLQYSFSLKPCLQDSHWASYAEQQIGACPIGACSILKAWACVDRTITPRRSPTKRCCLVFP